MLCIVCPYARNLLVVLEKIALGKFQVAAAAVEPLTGTLASIILPVEYIVDHEARNRFRSYRLCVSIPP
jgi:hypothetical protein